MIDVVVDVVRTKHAVKRSGAHPHRQINTANLRFDLKSSFVKVMDG